MRDSEKKVALRGGVEYVPIKHRRLERNKVRLSTLSEPTLLVPDFLRAHASWTSQAITSAVDDVVYFKSLNCFIN